MTRLKKIAVCVLLLVLIGLFLMGRAWLAENAEQVCGTLCTLPFSYEEWLFACTAQCLEFCK